MLSSLFSACAAAESADLLEAAESSHLQLEGLWNKICGKGKTATEERYRYITMLPPRGILHNCSHMLTQGVCGQTWACFPALDHSVWTKRGSTGRVNPFCQVPATACIFLKHTCWAHCWHNSHDTL